MNRPPFVAQDFPGKCKVFPERDVMLLPFQSKWVLDNSRLKLAVKARQIGFSWCTAYRIVREKLREGARVDAWIASRDEVQAQLFLQDAKRFADILNVAAADLGQTMIDQDGHTAFVLRFANGLRAHSMSSPPTRKPASAAIESLTSSRCIRIRENFIKSLTLESPGAAHWKSFLRTGAASIISTN